MQVSRGESFAQFRLLMCPQHEAVSSLLQYPVCRRQHFPVHLVLHEAKQILEGGTEVKGFPRIELYFQLAEALSNEWVTPSLFFIE